MAAYVTGMLPGGFRSKPPREHTRPSAATSCDLSGSHSLGSLMWPVARRFVRGMTDPHDAARHVQCGSR
jgi:hypothetical protein